MFSLIRWGVVYCIKIQGVGGPISNAGIECVEHGVVGPYLPLLVVWGAGGLGLLVQPKLLGTGGCSWT